MTREIETYRYPETLPQAIGSIYEHVLLINYYAKSPHAVLRSIAGELDYSSADMTKEEALGRLAAAAYTHEGDEEVERVQSVYGETLALVGLRMGIADEPIEVSAQGLSLAKIYALAPEIDDPEVYASFLQNIGPRGIYETPNLYALIVDTLRILNEQLCSLEENDRVFRRHGMEPFTAVNNREMQTYRNTFRAVMPAYYNAHLGQLTDYRELEERLLR